MNSPSISRISRRIRDGLTPKGLSTFFQVSFLIDISDHLISVFALEVPARGQRLAGKAFWLDVRLRKVSGKQGATQHSSASLTSGRYQLHLPPSGHPELESNLDRLGLFFVHPNTFNALSSCIDARPEGLLNAGP
jgi:hypothetical protein